MSELTKRHADIQAGDRVWTARGGWWWLHGKPEIVSYIVVAVSPTGKVSIKKQSGRLCYTNDPYFKTFDGALAYYRALLANKVASLEAQLTDLRDFDKTLIALGEKHKGAAPSSPGRTTMDEMTNEEALAALRPEVASLRAERDAERETKEIYQAACVAHKAKIEALSTAFKETRTEPALEFWLRAQRIFEPAQCTILTGENDNG